MFTYYAFRLGSFVAGFLPSGAMHRLLRRLAPLVAMLSPLRSTVEGNMVRISGSPRTSPAVRSLVVEVFGTMLENYFDLLRLPRLIDRDPESYTVVHHWERVLDMQARGKGVILIQAHLDAFELSTGILAKRVDGTAVLVERLNPPQLFEFLRRLRAASGVRFIPADRSGLREAMALLKSGGMLGIIADRDIQKSGERIDFLGAPARLPTGAATLAVRTGAAVVPSLASRHGDDHIVIDVQPPLLPNDSLPRVEAEAKLFREIAASLESLIKRAPGRWVVFESIWGDN